MKYIEKENRDDTSRAHSFDQGICTNVRVTLCTPEKGILSPSLYLTSLQGSNPPPLLLFLLSILSDSLLHSALTSHPSYLAGKGEVFRIQKNQDLYYYSSFVDEMKK